MKKRNRILSVLLCAAMVAGLAGCGSKNDSKDSGEKDGKIKLTFSTSVYVEEPHQKAIDALLEAYNKKNPDVEIAVLGAGYDGYWDNITNEIQSGTASDMIQVYPENISTYQALKPEGTDRTGYVYCRWTDTGYLKLCMGNYWYLLSQVYAGRERYQPG